MGPDLGVAVALDALADDRTSIHHDMEMAALFGRGRCRVASDAVSVRTVARHGTSTRRLHV